MLDQLRGRNLAHVGCTFGLVVGLIVGMVAGILIISLFSQQSAASWAALVWLGITGVLGAAGYALGSWATARLWGERQRDD
jgi:uncharacterized membrane protein YccC